MKIEIVSSSQGGMPPGQQVRITHEGKKPLLWDVSSYSRSRDRSEAGSDSIFDEINAYMASISLERQHMIYRLYESFREDLSTGYSMNSLQRSLQGKVKQLYELMPFDEISRWVRMDSNIRIPSSFKIVHGPDDSIDQTYLKKDYQDLAALAVALRAMVPIWGEFVKASRDYSGNHHKELEGLRLLYFSNLIGNEPVEPVVRLRDYIVATAAAQQKGGPSQATVMGGMGSSELPDYILSITIVRRLAVCAITGPDESINIITNIHQFILHNLRGMDRKFGSKFGGSITDKEKSASQKEESNDSLMEMYKIKQALADGDAVKINVGTEYIDTLVQAVDPTIPPEYVQACLQAIQAIAIRPLLKHQEHLMQWTLKEPLPAEGIPLINKESTLRALAVTQAALWHWGLYSLAVLATATPITLNDGIILGGNDLRGRMPKDQSDMLSRYFKHYRQPRLQNAAAKTYNPAARAIENFSTLVARSDWELHAPVELMQRATSIENYRRYEVTSDIRSALFHLIIKVTL